MVEWERTTAKNLGVKLVSRSSLSNRAYLTCDLFGVKRQSKTDTDVPKKRWSGTKKINCKFYLVGEQHYGDRWGIRILYGKHNHDPVHLFGHGSTKMTEEEVEITRMLAKSHVPPKKILIHLKEKNLAQDVHLKQIYNEKAKMKKEARDGHTIMPHLVGLLEEHKYYKWIRTDLTTHEIIDLMWAHPQSVEMLRLFPYVLLFDLAFMRHENEEHYTWALNNLRKLHLPNNVPGVVVTDRELGLIKGNVGRRSAQCLGNSKFRGITFVREVWQRVVTSLSVAQYESNLAAMVDEYRNNPDLFEYLETTWLIYKDRVESGHKAVKDWLSSSTGGFDTFWAQYHSQMIIQLNQILKTFGKSRRIRAKTINVPIFRILSSGIVTHAALLFDVEREKNVENCNCYLKNTHGLPCKYDIDLKESRHGGVFYAEDVHKFWRTMILLDGNQAESVDSIPDHRTQALGRLEGLVNELRQHSDVEINDVADIVFERNRSRGRSSTVSEPEPERIVQPEFIRNLHFALVPDDVTWKNVLGDGNCGYRSVACAVKGDEENWNDVRLDVYNFLRNNEEFFKDYYGGGNYIYQVMTSVPHWQNGPAPLNKWMTITDVGVVVATCYNALVLSTSSSGNQTYLPLFSPVGVSQLSHEMTIVYLAEGSHFVNDKGDSLSASYYHTDSVTPVTNTAVGAEVTDSFSSNENTITVGTQHSLDSLTTVKSGFHVYIAVILSGFHVNTHVYTE
ncbi:PREDICTED: uncharacterized protein LOC105952146 [Erythranthe guttata]|uniref:uncharacterized protein LOC105952146 n=1 Tax=Erythranthe guttata TaxID=4155 RepID=UPI00064DA777|nr:PREDICTED: uncharacterized protein LOC105952146 [Erythranthe guttata]|eukprot:XP_012831116.1 PREDICTED: uncharacterized protein LOC105952146 [Erythranthe guttata]